MYLGELHYEVLTLEGSIGVRGMSLDLRSKRLFMSVAFAFCVAVVFRLVKDFMFCSQISCGSWLCDHYSILVCCPRCVTFGVWIGERILLYVFPFLLMYLIIGSWGKVHRPYS